MKNKDMKEDKTEETIEDIIEEEDIKIINK
jgi:hypothetical protein